MSTAADNRFYREPPAAITAQLVDVRNLGTEKCIKMTLHVPAEQAMQVLEAFGWPTAVNPVPVAIARLEIGTHSRPIEPPRQETKANPEPVGAKERRPFESLPLPQQAGMLCLDPVFWGFVREQWHKRCSSTADATDAMYARYGVTTRSILNKDVPEGQRFIRDRDEFAAWKLVSA